MNTLTTQGEYNKHIAGFTKVRWLSGLAKDLIKSLEYCYSSNKSSNAGWCLAADEVSILALFWIPFSILLLNYSLFSTSLLIVCQPWPCFSPVHSLTVVVFPVSLLHSCYPYIQHHYFSWPRPALLILLILLFKNKISTDDFCVFSYCIYKHYTFCFNFHWHYKLTLNWRCLHQRSPVALCASSR